MHLGPPGASCLPVLPTVMPCLKEMVTREPTFRSTGLGPHAERSPSDESGVALREGRTPLSEKADQGIESG